MIKDCPLSGVEPSAFTTAYDEFIKKLFDVRGTTTMIDPCAGISFFPNPIPAGSGAVLLVQVDANNTSVTAELRTTGGVLVRNVYYNNSTPAGIITPTINTAGLSPGMYLLTVIRNSIPCAQILMIQ